MQLLAHLVGRKRDEVDLDVGSRKARIGLEEGTRGAGCDRQRSFAERCILQARKHLSDGMIDDVVERDLLRAARDEAHLHMILQIVADAGRVEHDLDAVRFQQIGGPDAGELQQLRRVVGAAGNQHLPARSRGASVSVLLVFDRVGALALEQDPLRQR